MDRRTTGWGLMLSVLSVLSVAVVAYRNDLSSTRHGCVWSTMDPNVKEGPLTNGMLGNPSLQVPQQQQKGIIPLMTPTTSAAGFSLNCNLRTLSTDSWNYTFNREQIERTRFLRVQCSDRLFFESFLTENQTLFQLRNLQEVQIDSCKIRKVPKRVWTTLAKLKRLSIRTRNTDWRSSSSTGLEIEAEAFQGLELETLDLSQNNIWAFPKNALCLRSIVTMNVSRNRLTDIEELFTSQNVGQNETTRVTSDCAYLGVQNLDLSFNVIRRVGGTAFTRMREISTLNLQNNLIAEVSDAAFEGLNHLKSVYLDSNRLVALPPFIFKTNVNLLELHIQNNSISALSSKLFRSLSQLLVLDLSRNTLTSQWVKEDIFQGLLRLRILKLNDNQLSSLDSLIFKDLISLQVLHIQNNNLETISPDAFKSLSNLHLLDLSGNRLSYIDGKLLSNLYVLRQAYFDKNKIKLIEDDAFKNCTQMEDLGLAGNSLQEVPAALQIANLRMLKTLDIGENKISLVGNSSFAGMSELYGLRMVDNRLTELPAGFCNSFKKVRVINVANNQIKRISPEISCPELRILRLDHNALEGLPQSLPVQLPSLLWFNLSSNGLRWLDYNRIPPNVEWLDASHCKVESIFANASKKSNSLHNLRVVDLSYNLLTTLDSTNIPPNVETFRANHNRLKNVAENTFLKSTRLRRVEMISNELETLEVSSLRVPPAPIDKPLPEFYLGKNNWNCCENEAWLLRGNKLSVLRNFPLIKDLDSISCKSTFSKSVVPLLEAKPQDFLCQYESHCFATCSCCGFTCDCESLCPTDCTCFHDAAWSSNIVKCSKANYTGQIPERIPMDVTELFLDGNDFGDLSSHIFIGKRNLRVLFLNDSNIQTIKNKTFNGLRSLEVLMLQSNLLSELNGYEFSDLESIREIYLENNMLKYIAPETFGNLKYLQVLRLDGNYLRDYPVSMLSHNGYLNSVTLGNNPWSCSCGSEFLTWVYEKASVIVDFHYVKCQAEQGEEATEDYDSSQLVPITSICPSSPESDTGFNYDHPGSQHTNEMEINNHISAMGGAAEKVNSNNMPPSENHMNFSGLDIQRPGDNTFWALILCLTGFLIVILVLLAIFRQEIYYAVRNALIHRECSSLLCCCCPRKYSGAHHPGKTQCPSSLQDDQEKLFDIFFLYNKQKDEDVLLQKIVPELEDPTTATTTPGYKFRMCLYYRDLCLTESPWNREMILSACDASKRVVILLSRNFLQYEWAHFRSVVGLHQKKIIFILLPDFDQISLSSLSSELSTSSLSKNSVQWSDKNFWAKFKRLLPKPGGLLGELHHHHHQGMMVTNNLQGTLPSSCDPAQLPYSLIMNPNLAHLQAEQQRTNHYHRNIIPYQIPVSMMTRNNSLPPVPKHQILLPATPQHTLPSNLGPQHHGHHHNPIISSTSIHPIPSQFNTAFGYSNETFHLQQSNHHQNFQNHHHPNNNHNQPIHFSSLHQNQNPHRHQVLLQPPHSHSHSHSHTSSQISHNFYPHHHPQNQSEMNYSSSAVSSCPDEFDHVYSTLDSPSDEVDYSPNPNGNAGGDNNVNGLSSNHIAQHSTSSGVSSGSDMTCGESSSAVSPSSPVKNGILSKLNLPGGNNTSAWSGHQNGKMYFV